MIITGIGKSAIIAQKIVNMLQKMRRHVTKDETYKLIEQFREEVPGIHLRKFSSSGSLFIGIKRYKNAYCTARMNVS